MSLPNVQNELSEPALQRFVDHADEQAFRELVSIYQPMVFAVCRRVLGTSTDAEDATHETFVKLSRHASTIRGNIGSWLYTCALNVARDLRHAGLARRGREREFTLRQMPPEEPSFDADEYSLLNRCMADLDDQDREVIALYYFLGLTQDRIASRYGITQVGVKRRLDRAIRSLRFSLVRGGFDLSTAETGRTCNVTCDGELDMIAFGAVLLGFMLDDPTGENHLAQCTSPVSFGQGLGQRVAAIAGGLMLTGDEPLSGRRNGRPVYRLSRQVWPIRMIHCLTTVAEFVRDGFVICGRRLRG